MDLLKADPQLLHMMDKWTECLEYGGQIDAIYSDFQKAFDEFHIRGYFLSCTHMGLTKLLLIGFGIFYS